MELIQWNPSLSVKIKRFDSQHMELVKMVNDLHDAMKVGEGVEILGKVVCRLISYTASHFAEEERLMAFHSYPNMADHKTKHEDFVIKVMELQQQFNSGQAILTLGVMMFLKNWLINHIQGDDRKYGVFLNSKGVD